MSVGWDKANHLWVLGYSVGGNIYEIPFDEQWLRDSEPKEIVDLIDRLVDDAIYLTRMEKYDN